MTKTHPDARRRAEDDGGRRAVRAWIIPPPGGWLQAGAARPSFPLVRAARSAFGRPHQVVGSFRAQFRQPLGDRFRLQAREHHVIGIHHNHRPGPAPVRGIH